MKPPRSSENELILGLVSISDRASRGIYDDEGIPALESWCRKAIKNPLKIHKRLIPDEQFTIEKTLRELVDIIGCDLILTTGGTGPARRDVTPEATLAVATREMPGFGEQMRSISGHFVPTAILSRQVAVLRETPDHAALIINLPGRPKAIAETLEGLKDNDGKVIVNGIFAAVPYCIDLIEGPYIETNEDVIKAFRPKSAQRPQTNSSDQPSKPMAKEDKIVEAPVKPAEPAQKMPPVEPFVGDDLLFTRPRQAGNQTPKKFVIMLHGMGVDNTDFSSFADDILHFGGPLTQVILPNAPVRTLTLHPGYPLRAWYDIKADRLDEKEDEEGLKHSTRRIMALIEQLEKDGVDRKDIYLGGFSQGATVALYAGIHLDKPLGGIFALSGYVPLAHKVRAELTDAGRQTPIFMANGAFDSIVSPLIAQRGAQVVQEYHPQFYFQTYNMDHQLDEEEMQDLASFLNR